MPVQPLTSDNLTVALLIDRAQARWSRDSVESMELTQGVLREVKKMPGADRFSTLIDVLVEALQKLIIAENSLQTMRKLIESAGGGRGSGTAN